MNNKNIKWISILLIFFSSIVNASTAHFKTEQQAYEAAKKAAVDYVSQHFPGIDPNDSFECSGGRIIHQIEIRTPTMGNQRNGYSYWIRRREGVGSSNRLMCNHSFWLYERKSPYADFTYDNFQCYFPYNQEGRRCAKFCPPNKPELDRTSGLCITPDEEKEPPQCKAGNPILVSSGIKVQTEKPDYMGAGAYPLSFIRNYQSVRGAESLEQRNKASIETPSSGDADKWRTYNQPSNYHGTTLDVGISDALVEDMLNGVRLAGFKQWHHNYESYLMMNANKVRLTRPKGNDRYFTGDGVNYKATNFTHDTLTRHLDKKGNFLYWLYRSSNNEQEHYNIDGKLTRKVNRAGLSHWLEYDDNGQLSIIKDDANNKLEFEFDDKNKLVSIQTPKHERLTYSYDKYANLSTMTKQFSSGKETVRTYHYEDSRHPYALTGITDEKGVRYVSWKYDELGRAVESKHANDTDITSFSFLYGKTIVTNPLGKDTIYHYKRPYYDDNKLRAQRLIKVEGVASANCLSANQEYTYYGNGMLSSKTDRKGIKTEFRYNERFLESQRIEAAGTPDERVVTTTWHPKFNLPISVIIGNSVTIYKYDKQGLLLSQQVSTINSF